MVFKDYSALITLLGNDFLPKPLGLSIDNDGIEVILQHCFDGGKTNEQIQHAFPKKSLKALAGAEEDLVAMSCLI